MSGVTVVQGPRTWKERLLEWADMRRPVRVQIPEPVERLAEDCDIVLVGEGGTHRRIIQQASRTTRPVVIWCGPQSLHGNAKFAFVSASSAYGVLLKTGRPVKLLFGFDELERKIAGVRAWLKTLQRS